MKASEAYNALTKEQRLDLLAELGFDNPHRYVDYEEIDTRYECLLYDVALELDKCWVRDKWVATPPEDRAKGKPVTVVTPKPPSTMKKAEAQEQPKSALADEVASGLREMQRKLSALTKK